MRVAAEKQHVMATIPIFREGFEVKVKSNGSPDLVTVKIGDDDRDVLTENEKLPRRPVQKLQLETPCR